MNTVLSRNGTWAAGVLLLFALSAGVVSAFYSESSEAVTEDFSDESLKYALNGAEVSVIGPVDSTAESITVPPSVSYNGRDYKVSAVFANSFKDCTGLKSVSLSDTIRIIGNAAFSGCINLETVQFRAGTEQIMACAFQNCTSLTSVSFPDTVKSIGEGVFKGCTKLETAELGSGIKAISSNCFSGCTSLKTFTIDENVSNVLERAFYGCTSLVQINILNSDFPVALLKTNAFALGTAEKSVYCKVNFAAYTPVTPEEKGFDEYTTLLFNSEKFTLTLILYETESGPVKSIITEFAGTSISVDDPTRSGFTFNGWNAVIPERMPAMDCEIKAKWTANANTLTLDPNGGIGSEKKYTIYSDTKDYLEEFVNLGFDSEIGDFMYWSDQSDGTGTIYEDHALFSTLCDITLYAIWTEQPYQVTFDKNNDKATGEMLKQPFGTDAKKLRENSFVLTGYKFAGWGSSRDSTEPVADPYTATASVTLYAIWTPITYIVVFDPNGGKGSIDEIVMTYDVPVKLPETKMSRTGYLMTGWSLSPSDNITAYKPGDTVVNLTSTDGVKVTLYSTWSANIYTIIFHPNNSEATGTMDPQFVRYDSTVSLTANAFQYKFYDFCGWSTVEGGTAVEYEDKASVKNLLTEGQMDLYAVWKVGQYHIIYDPGDGDGALMDFPWVTYFEEYTIPECTYTYSNHNFKGWLCEVDHKIYQPGDVVENLSDGYYQIILTAQWEFDYALWVPIIGSILGLVVICGASVVFLRRQHRS